MKLDLLLQKPVFYSKLFTRVHQARLIVTVTRLLKQACHEIHEARLIVTVTSLLQQAFHEVHQARLIVTIPNQSFTASFSRGT
jgi:hypothetical protein